ncbi:hypothetical protein P171DRAFT_369956 [Karstenula rhodostoma CBS 690.94]|uniref:Xylanolytic transcriptional activator regulatory domain-containing protein n=1 Tax=Karstenula rhodostoma CBS 690.94 TaxID=1392251 RepID=A0A9P4U6W9_9PLEO|nr:hypothetical protein P171DRAFT_369956 [Karstenula rhodostoma CBS 690.94]
MSDPSETSGRPSAPSIQQPESTIPPLTTPRRYRKPSHLSDERIGVTNPTASRRPGNSKQTTNPTRGDSSTMQRSASPTQMSPDSSVHYTRTGRISKAKKGLKVHHCDCGRSYTRAEHLRLDLLQRHQERHNDPGRAESPQMYSPASTADPEPQVSAPVNLPAPVATTVPANDSYYAQPVSPMPVSAADASHSKRAYNAPRQNPGPVSVPVDGGMQNGITWTDPFGHSPHYTSSSSDYPSPIPSGQDYASNMFANPPYGPGPNRTRNSSNASYTEAPWGYPSRSPTSATSTMAYTWNSNEKSPVPSHPVYMHTSYPMTSMPMPAGVDPMTGFGHFGPKTMVQRDEEEQTFLFPEQPYGMGQLVHTYPFEQYLNNYWRFFHAAYPLVHRATFESIGQPPMLHAAMIAIGGQYSDDASVKRKSRILHDRCMRLLDKRELDGMPEPERVCDWQALFLVEVMSQYRARRTAMRLSSRFETLYQKLCNSFREVTSNIVDNVSALVQPENATYARWTQWIELSTQQRLLLCCYILEYQQATLLARNSLQSSINCQGLDLPLPAHSELWDASTPSDWAMAAQQNPHQLTYVFQVAPEAMQTFDTFQSSLIIAAYYNHFNNPTPYLAPANFQHLDHLLDNSAVTKHQLLTAKLLQVVPIRALLAISGETWILSEKTSLPQISAGYRTTLRSWISGLWTDGADLQGQSAKDALKLAIEIVQHAMTAQTQTLRLELGADLGLYFAALTIWAATVAANTRINAPQSVQPHRFQSHSPLPTSYPSTPTHYSMNTTGTPHAVGLGLTSHPATSPVPPSTSAPSMHYSELTMLSINFLSTALVELDFLGVVHQWPRDVAEWKHGCAAMLRWVKMRLRGGATEGRDSVSSTLNVGSRNGDGFGGDGFGQLLDGVICALEKILIRGWDVWGF